MKIQIERNGEKIKVSTLKVHLSDDANFNLKIEHGELVITKDDFNSNQLVVSPNSANQISIK